MLEMKEDPVVRVCNVFSKINDRYHELLMQTNWREQPSVQALYTEFKGSLVDGMDPAELRLIQDEVLAVWEKHIGMIARQLRWGYSVRTLDVVLSLVCWEAVSKLSVGVAR